MLNLVGSVPKTIATSFVAPVAPGAIGFGVTGVWATGAVPQLCEPGFVSFSYGVSTFSCKLRGYEISLLKGIEIIIIFRVVGFGVMKLVASGKRMFN